MGQADLRWITDWVFFSGSAGGPFVEDESAGCDIWSCLVNTGRTDWPYGGFGRQEGAVMVRGIQSNVFAVAVWR